MFKVAIHGKRSNKVLIFLTGWHNKLWMYWIFAKFFEMKGYQCIVYEYDSEILSPDAKNTVKNFLAVKRDVLSRMKSCKIKDRSTTFSLYGTSLGSIITLMVANKSTDVTHVILNTVGNDLAEIVWGWDEAVPVFKTELVKKKYTLHQLKSEWEELHPINNIDKLENKKIRILISTQDQIIPVALGMKLFTRLSKYKYQVELNVNKKLKHIPTATYNLFSLKSSLQFLNS